MVSVISVILFSNQDHLCKILNYQVLSMSIRPIFGFHLIIHVPRKQII
jgi:hypothetical protein